MGNNFGLPTNNPRGNLPTLQRPSDPKARPGWSAPTGYQDNENGTIYNQNFTFDCQQKTNSLILSVSAGTVFFSFTVPPQLYKRRLWFGSYVDTDLAARNSASLTGKVDFYFEGSLVGSIPFVRTLVGFVAGTGRNACLDPFPFWYYGGAYDLGATGSAGGSANSSYALSSGGLLVPMTAPIGPDSLLVSLRNNALVTNHNLVMQPLNIRCSCDKIEFRSITAVNPSGDTWQNVAQVVSERE